MKQNIILAYIVTLILGGLIGWGVAHAATPAIGTTMPNSGKRNASMQPIDDAFNVKSTNLRLSLNTLLREHAAMGAITLTLLY